MHKLRNNESFQLLDIWAKIGSGEISEFKIFCHKRMRNSKGHDIIFLKMYNISIVSKQTLLCVLCGFCVGVYFCVLLTPKNNNNVM